MTALEQYRKNHARRQRRRAWNEAAESILFIVPLFFLAGLMLLNFLLNNAGA